MGLNDGVIQGKETRFSRGNGGHRARKVIFRNLLLTVMLSGCRVSRNDLSEDNVQNYSTRFESWNVEREERRGLYVVPGDHVLMTINSIQFEKIMDSKNKKNTIPLLWLPTPPSFDRQGSVDLILIPNSDPIPNPCFQPLQDTTPRHHLNVSSFALDTTTQLVVRPSPDDILYG